MRRHLLSVLVLIVASTRVEAACVDPATFIHSTVSITRTFNEEESKLLPGVVGIRGTGWFLAPRLIVTAAHVAEAMRLSAQEWKDIETRDGDSKSSVRVRILRLAGSNAEKIAVLELQAAIPGAAVLQSRTEPLMPDEQLVSLAYPNNQLRFAGGRFVRYGDDDRLAGTALLEMHDGNDRLVLDHGASGAAVLDCEGRVVAVVSILMTQTIKFLSNVIRTPTPWQSPNVVSIPIAVLKDFSWSD
jgi:Trypsin-like peptidase domain